MRTALIEQPEGQLAEIIDPCMPGGEVVLTRDNEPVTRIKAIAPRRFPGFGTMKGTIVYIAVNFDATPGVRG